MPASPEEALLVQYARAGAAGAAEELVRHCAPDLYRTALGVLGDAHEAEDAAQDAAMRLLRGARTYRPGGSFRAWLHRLAVNAARDRMRARARRAAVEKEGAMVREAKPQGREEFDEAVRAAVARLEEPRRSAVVLVYFQGLSRQEAAEALRLPVGTVSSALARAKEDLRGRLAGAGALAIGLSVEGLDSMLGALSLPGMPARVGMRLAEAARSGLGAKATAGTAAAAKGGVAMKVVAGVIAAGTLAGAVAVSTGMGRTPAPLAAMPEVKENPISKPSDREEVFEFAQKPSVKKAGGKVVISFATRGKCDATVAIVDGKGRVVRHLASGVLGSNAPWPFKQNSLSQSIEWDGTDDQGKKAPAGCKARVSLGLKASYGTTLAFNPYDVLPAGVACDREGNAYVIDVRRLEPGPVIRVYSREGKYLRTINPPPAGLTPKDYATTFDVIGLTGQPFYIKKPMPHGYMYRALRGMGMVVSSEGSLVWAAPGNRIKKHLRIMQTNGSGGRVGSQLGPWQMITGRAFLAFTKDESKLYVGGTRGGMGKYHGPFHCVLRFGLDDPAPKEWNGHGWGPKVPVFVGELDKSGADNAHLNDPHGVATDKDGNVYVCDYGNNRVQVFDSNAKHLRTIRIDRPDQIAVHRKTGDVYVLVPRFSKSDPKGFKALPKSKVVKFSPDGKHLATFEFPGAYNGNAGWITSMALDDSAERGLVWLGSPTGLNTWNGKGLWRVADKGNAFENLGDVARYDPWDPWRDSTSQYITVDRENRWLYMKNVRLPGYANCLARFDTATGKRDEQWSVTGKFDERHGRRRPSGKLPNGVDEQLVGPDGLLYIRGGVPSTKGDPEYVWRVDPETGKEVPFPAAQGGRIQFKGWHSPKFHRDGLTVAPNGDIYVVQHINVKLAGFKPEPWRAARGFTPLLLHHYGADGALKRKDILPGIPAGPGGVRVDRAGNIYMAHNMRPADRPYPELLWNLGAEAPKDLARRFFVGTLCKFGPKGGKIESFLKEGPWGTRPGRRRKATGLKASYVGLGPFGGGCVCPTCRADLDGFDRAYAPIKDLSCVMVLDSNFNRVARIGNYGGPDCQGPESEYPEPEIGFAGPSYLAVSDKSLYAVDHANRRVVRVDLGYEAEETVSLP